MLYHLSHERIPGNTFYPRVPALRTIGEDATIPRISFSQSIEGCISAMPDGIPSVKGLISLEKENLLPAILHLYWINENEIDSKNLVRSEELVKRNLVLDALHSGEVWVINQPITCHHKVVRVTEIKTDFITNYRQGKNLEYVTRCKYENATENFSREFIYHFGSKQISLLIRSYATIKNYEFCSITSSELKFKVSEGQNVQALWEKVSHFFWTSIRKEWKKDTKRKLFPIRTVLANFQE